MSPALAGDQGAPTSMDELEAGMSLGAEDASADAPPPPAQQAAQVEAAEGRDIAEGEQMYLISAGCGAGAGAARAPRLPPPPPPRHLAPPRQPRTATS